MAKNPNHYDEDADDQNDALKDDEGPSSTALLPKSILMGKEFNVGDEVVLKISAIHDNEVEVEYAPAEGKSEADETTPPDTTDEQPDDVDTEPHPEPVESGQYD